MKRYCRLLVAFFLCALGIMLTINCHIGVGPWDVLHIGMAKTLGCTMGQANILVGAFVIFLNIILKQPLGAATLLNILFIGSCVDLINMSGLVPTPQNLVSKYLMFIAGMLVFSYGTFFYIVQAKGCGPRDGLMQILNKRTGISVSIVKNSIELLALLVGWYLGGPVGIGTILYALTIGFFIQYTFSFHHVELKKIEHDSFGAEWRKLKKFGNKLPD